MVGWTCISHYDQVGWVLEVVLVGFTCLSFSLTKTWIILSSICWHLRICHIIFIALELTSSCLVLSLSDSLFTFEKISLELSDFFLFQLKSTCCFLHSVYLIHQLFWELFNLIRSSVHLFRYLCLLCALESIWLCLGSSWGFHILTLGWGWRIMFMITTESFLRLMKFMSLSLRITWGMNMDALSNIGHRFMHLLCGFIKRFKRYWSHVFWLNWMASSNWVRSPIIRNSTYI